MPEQNVTRLQTRGPQWACGGRGAGLHRRQRAVRHAARSAANEDVHANPSCHSEDVLANLSIFLHFETVGRVDGTLMMEPTQSKYVPVSASVSVMFETAFRKLYIYPFLVHSLPFLPSGPGRVAQFFAGPL